MEDRITLTRLQRAGCVRTVEISGQCRMKITFMWDEYIADLELTIPPPKSPWLYSISWAEEDEDPFQRLVRLIKYPGQRLASQLRQVRNLLH